MKKPEANKQIPKVLIPMIRDTFPEIVQSEIAYVKEEQIKTQISSFTMNDKLAELAELVKSEIDSIEQSIVPNPADEENLHITTNLDEWLETIKQNNVFSKDQKETKHNPYKELQYHLNFDYEIIKNASGYIFRPAFKYNGKVEVAKSINFSSLEEMKGFLSDKKYLLYYIIVSIKSFELEEKTLKIKSLDEPVIIYTFRGHILE